MDINTIEKGNPNTIGVAFVRVLGLAVLNILFWTPSAFAVCKRQALDLPVTIVGTRPVIPAKINNADVHFVIDSGAFFSMITQATADEFQLKTRMAPFGLRVNGVGGGTYPSVATVKTFALANIEVPNVEFLVGGSGAGSGSVGLLGQNVLEKWDVEYNLAQGMIRLMKVEDCHKAMLAYWVKPDEPYTLIDIARTTPLKPLTMGAAYVNGEKIRVAFDTGAAMSMITRKAAERAGIKLDAPDVVDAGLVAGIGRGMVKSYIVRVASFKFAGGEEIKQTRIRVGESDLDFTDMLIGADFFLSHRIFVANSQNKLYFTYNGGPVFNLATSVPAAPPTASDTASANNAADAHQPESEGKVSPDEPSDAAAWARRGTASAGRRDFDHAIADLTRACDLEPTNPEYFFERGQVYWRNKDSEKAIADFNRVIELKPDHVPALMNRAQLRINAKNIPEARADLDAIDKIAAKPAEVRYEMAFAYERANLLPSAISQFDLWIPAHDEDSRLAAALDGRCRAKAILGQDLAGALKDCNTAVSRAGKNANAALLDNRALVRFRLGDFDKSIADYSAALKLQPNAAWTLYGRGMAEVRSKKSKDGETDMANAVKIAPSIADAYAKLGITP
jgi:tetratricopeptide (TPR) repeat protein/predicted aspartyl protease